MASRVLDVYVRKDRRSKNVAARQLTREREALKVLEELLIELRNQITSKRCAKALVDSKIVGEIGLPSMHCVSLSKLRL